MDRRARERKGTGLSTDRIAQLTQREREVMDLLGGGEQLEGDRQRRSASACARWRAIAVPVLRKLGGPSSAQLGT